MQTSPKMLFPSFFLKHMLCNKIKTVVAFLPASSALSPHPCHLNKSEIIAAEMAIHQVPWSGHFRGCTQPPDFVPHVPLSVSVGPGICTLLVSEEARGSQVQTIPVNLATPHLGLHACVALMGLQGTGPSRRRTSTRWVPFSCSELSPPKDGDCQRKGSARK